jgi:hypothetical protein
VDNLDYYFEDKMGPKETQEESFWVRQGEAPTLPEENAERWVERLKKADLRKEEDLPKMVRRGLAVATRKNHRRIIRWMEQTETPKPQETVVEWLIRELEKKEEERGWRGSTLVTEMAGVQGALANMALYKSCPPVILKMSCVWKNGVRGAGVLARLEVPVQAKIALLSHIEKVMVEEEREDIRAAVEIMWITAGRGQDILNLRVKEVEAGVGGTKVRFVIGKTATSQPYTVNSAAVSLKTKEYLLRQREKGEEAGATNWLFPGVRVEELKMALRKVDVRLEVRSVRRGALQHLAAGGMSDESLMHYSQHRSVQTLRRYLDFGWMSGEGEERARRAKGLEVKGGGEDLL